MAIANVGYWELNAVIDIKLSCKVSIHYAAHNVTLQLHVQHIVYQGHLRYTSNAALDTTSRHDYILCDHLCNKHS